MGTDSSWLRDGGRLSAGQRERETENGGRGDDRFAALVHSTSRLFDRKSRSRRSEVVNERHMSQTVKALSRVALRPCRADAMAAPRVKPCTFTGARTRRDEMLKGQQLLHWQSQQSFRIVHSLDGAGQAG